MKPRRLHSDTIFSMSGTSFGSAIGRAVFLKGRLVSRRGGSGAAVRRRVDETPDTDGTSPHRADREIGAPMGAPSSGSCSGSSRWTGRRRENALLFLSLGDTRRVVQ